MSILQVRSVNGNSAIRAAIRAATFTIECVDAQGKRVEVRLSVDDRKTVVRETCDGKMEERCLSLAGEAQIRYGVISPQCGDTPVLPLQEALRLLAADPGIFKITFALEDALCNLAYLITLREYNTTWVLYGSSLKEENYFRVIPKMPTLEEVQALD